jgi:tetratricopeptide (TPR) repeat protein
MWRSALLLGCASLWCAPQCHAAFKSSYYSYVAALVALQQQDYPAAVSYLSYTIQEDPDAGEAYSLLLTIGVLAGDSTLVARHAEPALEHIQATQLLVRCAQLLLIGGRQDTARRYLEKAVELDPSNSEAVLALGRLYISSEPERASAFYERYLQRNPEDLDALFQAGIARYQAGNPDGAAETFREVLNRNPSYQDARMALADLLAGTTRQAEAEQLYRDSLALNPDNTDAAVRLIVLLLTRGAADEALPYVQRLERLPPQRFTPELAYLIAVYYEQTKQYRTAIRYMQRHIRDGRQPTPFPYLKLASYHTTLKEYSRAEQVLRRAVRAFDSRDARRMLVFLYMDTNRFREARDMLLQMERNGEAPERVDFLLAHCHDRLGEFDATEQRLLRLLERDPDDHEALNYLGYSYADRNTHLDRAERMVARALELQPENPAYLDSMGWVHYRRGRFREAEDYLRRASEKMEDAVILEHLGDTLTELRRTEEARSAYRRALALDPRNPTIKRKLRNAGAHP